REPRAHEILQRQEGEKLSSPDKAPVGRGSAGEALEVHGREVIQLHAPAATPDRRLAVPSNGEDDRPGRGCDETEREHVRRTEERRILPGRPVAEVVKDLQEEHDPKYSEEAADHPE